ncbi:MAG: hypothetical protein AAF725_12360 [Acidobacteriota bacterium]
MHLPFDTMRAAGPLEIYALAFWLALTAIGSPAAAEEQGLAAERIPWSELSFRAKKLFVTADAEVHLSRLEEDQLLMFLSSEVLGRTSETRLWLDASSARASREEKLKIKDKAELRAYAYAADHAVKERYHEREAEARSEPVETWTLKGSERQDYPGGESPTPVTSPSAILYVLAASKLAKPGDTLDVTIFTDRRLVTARAEVTESASARPLRLTTPDGAQLYEPADVLRIQLTGRDPAGAAVDLGLFGLEGDLEVLLDLENRLPLSIRGALPVIGKLSVRLIEAKLEGS